jgi:peptidoglycan/LPS O-acetylase OafA/YrhL
MLANFLFVHGFYPPAHNYIVPGGWSIGTEMAFYLCFPILFLMFKKISERGMAQFLILSALMICAYYFIENWYTTWAGTLVERNNFIYYNLLNQLPVFMLGILAYFLTREQVFARIPVIVDIFFFVCSLGLPPFYGSPTHSPKARSCSYHSQPGWHLCHFTISSQR